MEKLRHFADEHDLGLLAACQQVNRIPIGGKAGKSIVRFAETMLNLQKMQEFLPVRDFVETLLDKTGYLAALEAEGTLEADTRIENIKEFLSVAQEFDQSNAEEKNLTSFLTDVSLVSDLDEVDTESQSQVTMMTLHAAKGLEFPIVFIVGMEDGIFPTSRSFLDENAMEEERRLDYVGVTRAEKKLYLTNAVSRLLYGRTQNNPPSRFLAELDPNTVEEESAASQPTGSGASETGSQFKRTYYRDQRAFQPVYTQSQIHPQTQTGYGNSGAEKVAWQPGDKVKHRKWGIGVVVAVSGEGDGLMLDIAFKQQGIKRLLASFAPIKKVEPGEA